MPLKSKATAKQRRFNRRAMFNPDKRIDYTYLEEKRTAGAVKGHKHMGIAPKVFEELIARRSGE